ncbi:response regulator transcription factor [Caldalkalibacillus mannanilyticus]|uniref:response regulator transcription factor n=1 Tax=Caldalkalibacillus mannanilyticus TaxID=1418 RepID=UPI00046A13A1|nr:response regulator [Caldalkalibacillus mannanilyticus]
MKAIIIDDEIHVREGILLLADWERFNIDTVLEAQNGEEAMKLIEEHRPEIIFTDMRMPKKDGIELLRWIQESNITCKTIVISGYDDYHFMRTAIHYGSFDYILKPIEPDVLNETLEKAIYEWRKEETERQLTLNKNIEMNEVKPLYWDHTFTSLLEDTQISRAMIKKLFEEFNLMVQTDPIQVAVVSIDWIIEKHYKDQKDLGYFSLLNICNEILGKEQRGVAFRNLSTDGEIVCLCWKNVQSTPFIMGEIYEAIVHYVRGSCTIAISPVSPSIMELSKGYRQAIQIIQKANLLSQKNKRIFTQKDIENEVTQVHLFTFSNELKISVQSGSDKQIVLILNNIFGKMEKQKCVSLEQLELWDQEFQLLKAHWLKEFHIEGTHSLYCGNDYWDREGNFSFSAFQSEKQKEFFSLAELIKSASMKQENKTIYEIEKFIRMNYQKEIKLQEIAERFFLSREYISRKFKQEFNENISDYLVKIRMEKAKTLLQNEHMRIYDIASQIGYQDEKYFSKVFKKVEGLTPNEYRSKVKA